MCDLHQLQHTLDGIDLFRIGACLIVQRLSFSAMSVGWHLPFCGGVPASVKAVSTLLLTFEPSMTAPPCR